jgi:hypothetical protein
MILRRGDFKWLKKLKTNKTKGGNYHEKMYPYNSFSGGFIYSGGRI